MQDDDKLYGLIAQAEDIQKHAVTLQQVAQEAVKGLPGGYKEAVKGAAREILTEAAQNASTALLEACNEAKASSSALRRTGLLQAVFLLAVALIIAGASLGGLNWFIKSRLSELAEVKSAIQAEKATLADLQSKWTVNRSNILYKCGWSPFEETTFNSKIKYTFVNGVAVYQDGQLQHQGSGQRLLFTLP